MRHALLPVLLLFACALCHAQDERQQAWDLLRAAQDAIKAGKLAEAETKILQAKELDPRYPDVYSNLGYLYSLTRDKSKALEAYGQLLTLRPDNDYGRRAFKRLFYDLGKKQGDFGLFPRMVRAPFLAFSGVGFAHDEVRLLLPSGEATRRLAYTNSLLFHEDMGRGDGPVSVALPVTGNAVDCQVNRSCYGYLMPADSDRYTLAFSLSYPSETLPPGKNLSALSNRLMHMLLRFRWYGKTYLRPDLPDTTLTRAFLCPQGPTGAESYKDTLYFYDAGTERASIEWARQAAHELGHMLLPPLGRFTRPEPFASGFLGERLFLQYLALEAGLVAGDPWPSPAAQQAVNALWPGEEFQLANYLAQSCRASLDYWLGAGPDSPLASGTGEDAMQYTIGFVLWLQAGFDPELTRLVLQPSTATAVPPGECVYAFKTALRKLADRGPLELKAGSVNLAVSKLTTKPDEGALGRTNVKLAPGDSATFTMYLPAGAWAVQAGPSAAGLTLMLDGKGPLPFSEGGVPLGRLEDGWHTLSIQAGEKTAPFILDKLIFTREKEA